MASLVPEPMEKCAVCAASPSSTTLPSRQVPQRTVAKLSQRELLASSACPSSTSREELADPRDRRLVRLAGREVSSGRRQLGEAGRPPDVLVHLDDERAAGGVVGVAVDLHDAVRGLLDVELEGVEDQVGAQPHVLAVAKARIRAGTWPSDCCGSRVRRRRRRRPGRSSAARSADVRGLGAEVHGDAELGAALLQEFEQPSPAHRGEAVPAAGDDLRRGSARRCRPSGRTRAPSAGR